jgi:hypothetical protein
VSAELRAKAAEDWEVKRKQMAEVKLINFICGMSPIAVWLMLSLCVADVQEANRNTQALVSVIMQRDDKVRALHALPTF